MARMSRGVAGLVVEHRGFAAAGRALHILRQAGYLDSMAKAYALPPPPISDLVSDPVFC
jgi:hypothetical protein